MVNGTFLQLPLEAPPLIRVGFIVPQEIHTQEEAQRWRF